jgi:Protein of unknown function (DUF2939)
MVTPMINPESPTRPRYRGKLFALFAALLLLYGVSPYYSVWRFGEAIRAHDMEALSARVDFDAVRGSLKQQIRERFLGMLAKKKKDRLAQFLAANAGDPLDQLIDSYITPEGLAAIISDPAPIKNASSLSSLPGITGGQSREIDWSKFRHAYFTSPRDFAVDHEGIKLRFRFNGLVWKLHDLDLQLDQSKTETLKN